MPTRSAIAVLNSKLAVHTCWRLAPGVSQASVLHPLRRALWVRISCVGLLPPPRVLVSRAVSLMLRTVNF